MKKNLLIIVLLVVCVMTLTGCNKTQDILTDGEKFKKEYESFNGEKNDYFEYRSLSINENNPFVYTTDDDVVQMIEDKETFYVYFGDPECPWCRSVIEQAVLAANENNINKIYYVRIWDGFHNEILRDVYELNDDVLLVKKKGTDAYYKLLSYFDSLLSEYTLTLENGEKVNVNEKRIFAPNFIYVENGVAKKLVQGISSKQESYNSNLTDDILEEEKEIFNEFFN